MRYGLWTIDHGLINKLSNAVFISVIKGNYIWYNHHLVHHFFIIRAGGDRGKTLLILTSKPGQLYLRRKGRRFQMMNLRPAFTPDGNTVYFSSGPPEIYFSKLVNNKWAKPKLAVFSGRWKDMDPFISPDGGRLFFSSYRPLDGTPQSGPQKNAHIWYVDRLSGDNWSAPHHLEAPVNLTGIDNYAPSVSRSGMLCFFSPRRDINNKGKSYYTKWLGWSLRRTVKSVLSLNGFNGVRDPFISPDERYLIFGKRH